MQTLARLIPAALLGIVAFTLVLVITDPPGPGLDPDALSYMGAAESVALHGEYRIPLAKWASPDSTEPLAHFPPAYPTVLALPIRLGMTPAQGARFVNATAAFITITTLVLLVGAVASTSGGSLLAVALFAMTSMHEVHVSVLSEPLYLACLALVLAAMVLTPDRPLRAGIPAAVGVMTRYAGASLVGAVALWALLQPGTWLVRARRAAIALLPALLLQAAWVLRTRAEAGTSEIRKFALYGNLGPTFAQGGKTLIAWLIPYTADPRDALPYRATLALAAGCALALLVGIGAWRAWSSARAARESGDRQHLLAWRLFGAASLLMLSYAGVVGASRILADPEIPLDQRMLAPALVLVMTMAAVGLTLWWRSTRLQVARVAVAVALVVWWCAAALATRADSRYVMRWGSDFAGEQWRESELLAWARTAGADKPLYTNWPAAVYFYLHRPSHEIPKKSDARTMAAFADTLRAHGGRVLLFNVKAELLAPNDSLLNAPGLQTIQELRDGVVMRSDP
ncbi:MAG: hypothetical protein ABI625_09585 [bacterium]